MEEKYDFTTRLNGVFPHAHDDLLVSNTGNVNTQVSISILFVEQYWDAVLLKIYQSLH